VGHLHLSGAAVQAGPQGLTLTKTQQLTAGPILETTVTLHESRARSRGLLSTGGAASVAVEHHTLSPSHIVSEGPISIQAHTVELRATDITSQQAIDFETTHTHLDETLVTQTAPLHYAHQGSLVVRRSGTYQQGRGVTLITPRSLTLTAQAKAAPSGQNLLCPGSRLEAFTSAPEKQSSPVHS